MTGRIRSLCAALLVVGVVSGDASAADWVRVDTPNFVVFGEVGEKRTKEVAAEFERFREAIGRVLPGAVTSSAVPATVVVFDNQRTFAPYRPTFNGKPVPLGGFFMGSESSNMIALADEYRDQGLRIIFHEYTHLITANTSRVLPTWASEGLAEFYSTFAIADETNGAVLGKVIPAHYQLLGSNALLPLEQLLTVDHTSSLYNEGQRRSIFYAQSWATIHMLILGEPNRSKEFSEYVRQVAIGTPSLDAWRKAFGDLDVNRQLKRYLSLPSVRNYRYKFDDRLAAVDSRVSRPSASDVEAALAALLRYSARDQAEPRLRRAVAMSPPSMLARALLGSTLMRSGQHDEAQKHLLEAAGGTDDWLVQYYVVSGLDTAVRRPPADEHLRTVARRAVDAVLTARPDLAHALSLKAALVGKREGAALAARARVLAPGREDYVFLEAGLRADAGDFAEARAILSPLLTPRFPASVRDSARRFMGQIVRNEQASTRASDPARSESPSPPSNAGRADEPRPVFRDLKDGEQRVEGRLERLECGAKGSVTLVVRVDADLKRFTAAAFSDIDFVSYRDELSGAINCGERRPADRVYVTWRDNSRPVAVEFLPDRR
jgi:tetratricopeptide (TPR) repeat protein